MRPRMLDSLLQRGVVRRVVLANAAVLLAGAIVGPWFTRTASDLPLSAVSAIMFIAGLMVAGIVNYLVLRTSFRPLVDLSRALASVHKGEHERRLPHGGADPSLDSVSRAVDEMLDRLDDESRRYSSKMFEAIEEERRRIGRELHDDTSQTLAAALIGLDQAAKSLTESPDSLSRVENAIELIRYCLDQIKLLVYDLRPSMLDDLGLVPALRWYVDSHLGGSGIEVITDFSDGGLRLPADVETALYRIAQESLSNVVRHSMATRAEVDLELKPGYAALAVIDNGKGFVPDEVMFDEAGRFGIGLLSIKERVELLDGTVRIESSTGRGTRVHVVIPLEVEAQ
jgi:two-component system, NarL family, sensor histidine kinase UhpB